MVWFVTSHFVSVHISRGTQIANSVYDSVLVESSIDKHLPSSAFFIRRNETCKTFEEFLCLRSSHSITSESEGGTLACSIVMEKFGLVYRAATNIVASSSYEKKNGYHCRTLFTRSRSCKFSSRSVSKTFYRRLPIQAEHVPFRVSKHGW